MLNKIHILLIIILKKAPGFKWVKDELYPEFKKITQ